MNKEISGLEQRRVFKMLPLSALIKQGFVTRERKAIPIRVLLDVKVDPPGKLDKLKGRATGPQQR